MEGRAAFFRGMIVGVLVMMVLRSAVWLLTPSQHPDATMGSYVLNVTNILICGGTAWSTATVSEELTGKLHQLLDKLHHLPIGRR
jgi:hypothetical protein